MKGETASVREQWSSRSGFLLATLGYAVGLLNLKRNPIERWSGGPFHDFEADPAYNRVAQLTGTYFFKL